MGIQKNVKHFVYSIQSSANDFNEYFSSIGSETVAHLSSAENATASNDTLFWRRSNRPYSRRGHDGQKERLGLQIYRKFARQYVNSIVTSRSRDVTSLFRHLPYDVLFKKTRHCFNI